MSEICEVETAQQLREAMRVFAYNNINPEHLGMFKGIREGITMTMKLEGTTLSILPYQTVDVSTYKDKIQSLEETVKEQKAEITRLNKKPRMMRSGPIQT